MQTVKVNNKRIMFDFSATIHGANRSTIGDMLSKFYHEDIEWNGPQPLNTLNGLEALTKEFWQPFLTAFPDLQKNDYILFAGRFHDSDWVCSTGNFLGTFTNDWLNIPATGRPAWIRFGEFNRMVDGKVKETFIIFDLLDLMRQAGFSFLPCLAPEILIPGPATFDGIQLNETDDEQSEKSLQLVENMIFKGLASYKEKGLKMGLELYWHEDMMWYGPCSLGSTRGIEGFQKYYQGPFLKGLPDRVGGNHFARFAEGNYCASGGWPSVRATHAGSGWLGLPATNKKIEMRVMDWWRREGDLLAENWVFIDMIDVLLQLDIDIFERLKQKQFLI